MVITFLDGTTPVVTTGRRNAPITFVKIEKRWYVQIKTRDGFTRRAAVKHIKGIRPGYKV